MVIVILNQAKTLMDTTCRGWILKAAVRPPPSAIQTSTKSSKQCLFNRFSVEVCSPYLLRFDCAHDGDISIGNKKGGDALLLPLVQRRMVVLRKKWLRLVGSFAKC